MKKVTAVLFSLVGTAAIAIAQVLNLRKHSLASELVEELKYYGYNYEIDTNLSMSGIQYTLYSDYCVGMNLHIPIGGTDLDSVIRYLDFQLERQRTKEEKSWAHEELL